MTVSKVDLPSKSTVVSLVGLPGSGKSTVGKALRDNFGWFYADSDEEIEKRTSRTAANIIREDGEKAFRAIESEVIHQLVCDLVNRSGINKSQHAVLSLGGGAVTVESVLNLLKKETLMINLEVSVDEQIKRLGTGSDRPLIEGGSLELKLKELREKRSKLYDHAKYKLVTDNKTAYQLAAEILDLIKGV